MAAGILPAPGTRTGPCAEPCEHMDCRATRENAAAECIHCNEPIGYDTRYYRIRQLEVRGRTQLTADPIYVHALCEEKSIAGRLNR